MKKSLIVLQEGSKDCGAACLLSIVRYYGGDISLERLINMTKTDKEGTNFYSLSLASYEIGLASKGYNVDVQDKIKDIDTPFIAQINNKNYMHFVVVYKINDNSAVIMDPSKGKVVMDLFEFTSIWTGNIMVFEKIRNLPMFKEERPLNKILINTILRNIKCILFLLLLSLIFTIFSSITSFYSQVVFDKVIDTSIDNLTIVTVLFSVLYIVKTVTSFIRNYLLIYFNQKLDVSVILSTFTKIILLPYYYYKNRTTGEILSKINDLFSLKGFVSKIIVGLFLDSITFIVSLIIIYFINSKILFVFILILFIYLLIILIFNYPIKMLTKEIQESNSLVNNSIIESVSSFETIKNLNVENIFILKFSKVYANLLNTIYKKDNIGNMMFFIKDIFMDVGLLGINYLVIRFIMKGSLTMGNYMTITFLSSYLIYPIKNIVDILNEYHYIKNAIVRANNLLDTDEDKIYDKRKLEVNGNIVVNNLSYSYNNKNNIFSNLNFYIKSGDRVLILGSSGIGKSTIMKLLYKYYDVERNKMFINNYDINDYSVSDIRNGITYISQNEMLFTLSIRDNIILDREIDEEKFLRVCKNLYIDEIVKDNLLGYDYILEENGVNLSGGQRQRVILARGLLKNSNVVMIDEGFSEIDTCLERKILNNIFNLYRDKTFIVISHRKDNMDLYNRMILIDKNGSKNYERGDI